MRHHIFRAHFSRGRHRADGQRAGVGLGITCRVIVAPRRTGNLPGISIQHQRDRRFCQRRCRFHRVIETRQHPRCARQSRGSHFADFFLRQFDQFSVLQFKRSHYFQRGTTQRLIRSLRDHIHRDDAIFNFHGNQNNAVAQNCRADIHRHTVFIHHRGNRDKLPAAAIAINQKNYRIVHTITIQIAESIKIIHKINAGARRATFHIRFAFIMTIGQLHGGAINAGILYIFQHIER